MATFDPPPPVIDPKNQILIRSVWSANSEFEFSLILNLIDQYRFISMDTEFPGAIFPLPEPQNVNPTTYYQNLKSNVNDLKLIQVGITLVDSSGNLPNLGFSDRRYIWEFNFRDFDESRDPHAKKSIDMLRKHGFNFDTMREFGVSAAQFAELMMSSGLVCSDYVTYVTFQGGFDFGYLLKVLTGKNLPETLPEFLELLRVFFGNHVYDVKHIIKFIPGLGGGLDRVAELLDVHRSAGRKHEAGSDSLLTWLVFEKIMVVYFGNGADEGVQDRFGYGVETQ